MVWLAVRLDLAVAVAFARGAFDFRLDGLLDLAAVVAVAPLLAGTTFLWPALLTGLAAFVDARALAAFTDLADLLDLLACALLLARFA